MFCCTDVMDYSLNTLSNLFIRIARKGKTKFAKNYIIPYIYMVLQYLPTCMFFVILFSEYIFNNFIFHYTLLYLPVYMVLSIWIKISKTIVHDCLFIDEILME